MSLTPLFDPGESPKSIVNDGCTTSTSQIPTIDNRELTFIEHVARGGMAQISLYHWNRQGYLPIKVAKKSLFRGTIEARYEASLKREMGLLARLDHKNIVTTFGMVETDHDFGLVMEYLSFGSCGHFFWTLQNNAAESLPNFDKTIAPLKVQIIEEVIDGMNYLHGLKPKKVLHLDLKSDNVLLDDNLHAKICDFGLSKMATLTLLRNTTTVKLDAIAGTPGYIPPETLQNPRVKPTSKSDVYAFSIFLWELLADRMPYEDIDCRQINLLKIYVVDQEGRPDENCIPEVYPQELIGIMKQAWSQRPEDRPSFMDMQKRLYLLKHYNPDLVRSIHDSTRQVLELCKWMYTSSLDTAKFDTVRDEGNYWSMSRSDSAQRTTSTTAESTTPKWLADTYQKQQSSGQTFPGDEERLVSSHTPRDGNSGLTSSSFMANEKKYSYLRTFVAIIVIVLLLSGVGVIIWIEVTHHSDSGCLPMPSPTDGNVSCTSTETHNILNTKCTFSCHDGYSIQGENTIVCSGGKWSGKSPICVSDCPALPQIINGEYKCSNGNVVNSKCNFTCDENYDLKGKSSCTCQENSKWSDPEPTCECPPCYIGFKCQNSINWTDVLKDLQEMKAYGTIQVNYGGQLFTCTTNMHSITNWSGVCTDKKTSISAKCPDYSTPPESAQRAAAELVRKLVAKDIYPSPCDPEDMDIEC